jgi:hypothetical protein
VGWGILQHSWDIFVPIVVALLTTAGVGIFRARERERSRDEKLNTIIGLFEGHGPDPITGRKAEPGIIDQIEEIRSQLFRNGGASLRDAIARTEQNVGEIRLSITEAAAEAARDRRRAATIERLLRVHMDDGAKLLEFGLENDRVLWAALREHGIEIEDPLPLPPVTLLVPEDEEG